MFIPPRVCSAEAPPPAGSPLLRVGAGPALVTSLGMVLTWGLHGHIKHGVLVSTTSTIVNITSHALTLIQAALDDQFL